MGSKHFPHMTANDFLQTMRGNIRTITLNIAYICCLEGHKKSESPNK